MENKDLKNNLENNIENNIEPNLENNLEQSLQNNTQIPKNIKTTNKHYPNKFIEFVDKHYFGISAVIGSFYTITFIFVMIFYAYNTNPLGQFLYTIYVCFFIAYLVFYLGMTIVYRDVKYILSIILGFIIGFFTCGGLFIVSTSF